MTSAELEQRNIDVMGETLGKQYSVLFREVAALHLYWSEFLELFATNDKRIERLNQAAPTFFQMLQEQQFETNMSHLARLTDRSEIAGKQKPIRPSTCCMFWNGTEPRYSSHALSTTTNRLSASADHFRPSKLRRNPYVTFSLKRMLNFFVLRAERDCAIAGTQAGHGD
jgi:hypothetical protein